MSIINIDKLNDVISSIEDELSQNDCEDQREYMVYELEFLKTFREMWKKQRLADGTPAIIGNEVWAEWRIHNYKHGIIKIIQDNRIAVVFDDIKENDDGGFVQVNFDHAYSTFDAMDAVKD